MAKANHGGATAAGWSGIVEHAAPLADGRRFSELDPELNLDGTLVEGEHPDHVDGEERDPDAVPRFSEPAPIESPEESPEDGKSSETEREEESSPGTSSKTSTAKTPSTPGKSGSTRR